MDDIRWPHPEKERMLGKIRALPYAGRPIAPKKVWPCTLCGRAIEALGRLPYPGFPLCTSEACSLTPLSHVTKIFPTPYGCAVHLDILSILSRIVEMGDRVFLARKPLVDRDELLCDAYLDLLKWQRTYDTYERLSAPDGYAEGKVQIVPPRRLDEVIALRAVTPPVPIDPTRTLPHSTRQTLHRIYQEGPKGFELPF